MGQFIVGPAAAAGRQQQPPPLLRRQNVPMPRPHPRHQRLPGMPFQQPRQSLPIGQPPVIHFILRPQIFGGSSIHQKVEIDILQGIELRYLQHQQPQAGRGQSVHSRSPGPPRAKDRRQPAQSHRRQQAKRAIDEIEMPPAAVLVRPQNSGGQGRQHRRRQQQQEKAPPPLAENRPRPADTRRRHYRHPDKPQQH